jgi:uncharacterized protein (TIGR00369 family)
MNYIEKIRARGRDANPFFSLMGIDVVEIEDGDAVISMKVRPDMQNGEGWLQGGIFTALADEAMVLAIYPLLERNERLATISEHTTFISGAREGILYAAGRVVKRGRRVIFAEGEVRSGGRDGKILSRTTAAFAVGRE